MFQHNTLLALTWGLKPPAATSFWPREFISVSMCSFTAPISTSLTTNVLPRTDAPLPGEIIQTTKLSKNLSKQRKIIKIINVEIINYPFIKIHYKNYIKNIHYKNSKLLMSKNYRNNKKLCVAKNWRTTAWWNHRNNEIINKNKLSIIHL